MTLDCELVVAGGGPTGLLTALLCAEAGISVRVLERAPALPRDLRATSFHPPTLDMLESIGLDADLAAQGIVCPSWQIRIHPSGERAVFELARIADETRHPFRLQCEQWRLSELLLDRLRGMEKAEMTFGAAVVAATQDDAGVSVTFEKDGRRETLRAAVLVGADGVGSLVREAVGLPFEGETLPETTIVITTPFRFEDHLDGMSLVTSCWTEDSHIAFLRLPDFWRLALYPDEALPLEPQMTQEAIGTGLSALIDGHPPIDFTLVGPYRIQQRLVPRYRVGRVALVGDAAHVNSPAGGMGLNAGIHDAFELAPALIDILRGGAAFDRLDLYDRRRRPVVAQHILAQAGRNRARMRVRDPEGRRRELAELQAIAADPVRHKAFVMRASMIDGLRQAAAWIDRLRRPSVSRRRDAAR